MTVDDINRNDRTTEERFGRLAQCLTATLSAERDPITAEDLFGFQHHAHLVRSQIWEVPHYESRYKKNDFDWNRDLKLVGSKVQQAKPVEYKDLFEQRSARDAMDYIRKHGGRRHALIQMAQVFRELFKQYPQFFEKPERDAHDLLAVERRKKR